MGLLAPERLLYLQRQDRHKIAAGPAMDLSGFPG